MGKLEDGYRSGKSATQEQLMTRYSAILKERALVQSDISELIEESRPKSGGVFASIGSLFGVKPKEPEKKPNKFEQGYETAVLEEKARFVKLFMDWFANLKTMDEHTFNTKFSDAVYRDKNSLDWHFMEPNIKEPPAERLAPRRYTASNSAPLPSEESLKGFAPFEKRKEGVDVSEYAEPTDPPKAYDAAVEELHNIMQEFTRPEFSYTYGLPNNAFLFYGKKIDSDLLLKIVLEKAVKAGSGAYVAHPRNVIDDYVGQTEKNVGEIFFIGLKQAPCLLIFPDIQLWNSHPSAVKELAIQIKELKKKRNRIRVIAWVDEIHNLNGEFKSHIFHNRIEIK